MADAVRRIAEMVAGPRACAVAVVKAPVGMAAAGRWRNGRGCGGERDRAHYTVIAMPR